MNQYPRAWRGYGKGRVKARASPGEGEAVALGCGGSVFLAAPTTMLHLSHISVVNEQDFALVSSNFLTLAWLGTATWGKAMGQPKNLEKMSIDELWELHGKISEVLAAKINAEKQKLERRLISLRPLANHTRIRRPYPPVLPKFANPDAPEEVWSGRGKMPRWVTEKLSSGLALEDLSIVPSPRGEAWMAT